MRMLVTGCAGFIGSTLTSRLLEGGHEVTGIDCLTDYYDPDIKRRNVDLLAHDRFRFVQADLCSVSLPPLVEGVDVVFHLAGQPGVRGSWSEGFKPYLTMNVLATQRLLEAANAARTPRLVYASSSSVYGNEACFPSSEDQVPSPFSPYGVTKLAGEHLARLYARNHGLSTVSLRYFTVYGPRQRPEMAMSQLIGSALAGQPFSLFAAAGTVRDFTFVEDVVQATIAAGVRPDVPAGAVLNICGGSPATMDGVVDLVADLLGRPVVVAQLPVVAGDVLRTGGDSSLAQRLLDWRPAFGLREGIERQLTWTQQQLALPLQRSAPTVIDLRDSTLSTAAGR